MVDFLNLKEINARFRDELREAFARVLDRGWYILGEEVERFEAEFAAYNGAKFCVGVGNGLEALRLSILALDGAGGEVGEVIVPANTYIATALAVTDAGAKLVLAEPSIGSKTLDPLSFEQKIGRKTIAVMPVHLYGKIADMEAIAKIAADAGIAVIEDAAQAHGARDFRGLKAGGFGSFAAGFSFYPSKNLGALGDAGAIVTDSADTAARLKTLRNYGAKRRYIHDEFGINSRLDEMQAAFLRVKLRFLDADNQARQRAASLYCSEIKNSLVVLPDYAEGDVWHLFVVLVENRDRFMDHLRSFEIDSLIHYPLAIHQEGVYSGCFVGEEYPAKFPIAERLAREVVSLPISPVMSDLDIERVIYAVNSYR